MKKLYRKGTVHPSPSSPSSPSPSSPSSPSFSLSFLPAAILTLAASLSMDDKQVLAYLLSCSATTPFDSHPSNSSSTNKKHMKTNIHHNSHPNSFSCYCFTCYTTYWSRWDASPNRQLIHEIIDAFEDHVLEQNNKKKKKQGGVNRKSDKNKNVNARLHVNSQGSGRVNPESNRPESVEEDKQGDEAGDKQGSVTKMMTFLWQNVWG